MKKISLLIISIIFTCCNLQAQFNEIKPHFLTIAGGVSTCNLPETKAPGYVGRVEAAYFANYMFGAGLNISNSFFSANDTKFADAYSLKPQFNYSYTSASISQYYVGNYTANVYFSAVPSTKFSFMLSGGLGLQILSTPSGSILYKEKVNGVTSQSATIDIQSFSYKPVVFHFGARTNFMFNDFIGFNIFADYHYAKNKAYNDEQYHEVSGGVGLTFMFAETF